jgi:hypothetical protein
MGVDRAMGVSAGAPKEIGPPNAIGSAVGPAALPSVADAPPTPAPKSIVNPPKGSAGVESGPSGAVPFESARRLGSSLIASS